MFSKNWCKLLIVLFRMISMQAEKLHNLSWEKNWFFYTWTAIFKKGLFQQVHTLTLLHSVYSVPFIIRLSSSCTPFYCCTCTLYTFQAVPLYSFLLMYLYFVYISSCTTVLFITAVPVLCLHFQLYTVLFITAVPVLCIYLQLYHCTLYYCCNCTLHKFSTCTHCTL